MPGHTRKRPPFVDLDGGKEIDFARLQEAVERIARVARGNRRRPRRQGGGAGRRKAGEAARFSRRLARGRHRVPVPRRDERRAPSRHRHLYRPAAGAVARGPRRRPNRGGVGLPVGAVLFLARRRPRARRAVRGRGCPRQRGRAPGNEFRNRYRLHLFDLGHDGSSQMRGVGPSGALALRPFRASTSPG